jgi:hypothetical protein
MFGVSVAPLLKVAFKQESDRRIRRLADSLINVIQKIGIAPFNLLVLLESQNAMGPAILQLPQRARTGTEVNEMVLTFGKGSELLRQREGRRSENHSLSKMAIGPLNGSGFTQNLREN